MFNKFFYPIVDNALAAKIQPDQVSDGANMAIFASCVFSEPRAAHFRHAF